jgi:UDP-GlcNAc:undecaprenyl-phosphate GlcNAc-1-phosphate transferase
VTPPLAIAAACAFAASLLLTLVAERVAPRLGLVARPSLDRWHRQTIPLLGGAAIVIATIATTLLVVPLERRMLVLCVGSAVIAGVGLVDDVRALTPQTKLLAQILLAGALLQFGFELRLTGYRLVDMLLTLFWLVGVTNAFNLLDNMDALAGTIAIVAAAFRLLFFHWEEDVIAAAATAAFIGAVGGFLVRNAPPARIFMGDTGSLFLGFFLAALSISAPAIAYSRGLVAVIVIPVLLVLIPIFDTVFVTATRILAGRSPATGGRDHTSHRLVAVGLSERQTVLFLALISTAGGGVAVLSYGVGLSYSVVVAALLLIGLVLFGIHLSRAHLVQEPAEPNGGTILALIADSQYKRHVVTMLLDATLIPLAYYAAYVIRFEDDLGVNLPQFAGSLPVVLLVQLGALAAFGVYRGLWQFTSVPDLWRIAKAVALGTMGAVVVLVYTQRFAELSRTVFVLHAALLLLLIAGSRISFRVFAEVLRPRPPAFGRVLIYGAGVGGELVLRELRNNPALERVPIGFIDDDRGKHATRIHGLPVLGTSEQVEALLREHAVSEVIVSSGKITGNGLLRVSAVCQALDIPVRRATLTLQ